MRSLARPVWMVGFASNLDESCRLFWMLLAALAVGCRGCRLGLDEGCRLFWMVGFASFWMVGFAAIGWKN